MAQGRGLRRALCSIPNRAAEATSGQCHMMKLMLI
jgi:hypothetical protein